VYICRTPLLVNGYRDAVKDHCHITGKYRGAAHSACNLKLRIKPKMTPIPVIFHNLKGYDGHLLMHTMVRVQGEISCILNNTEKNVSFSLGNLRFIDSLNFMMSSLDLLVTGSVPEDMKIMGKACQDNEKRKLLVKKGIYLYKYMDSFASFVETALPPQEEFFSKVSGKGITDEEYAHAKKVGTEFGCKTQRLPQPVREDRRHTAGRRIRKLPKSMHGKVRTRPSPLLHSPRSELGYTAEKDRCRAGALERPRDAPVY